MKRGISVIFAFKIALFIPLAIVLSGFYKKSEKSENSKTSTQNGAANSSNYQTNQNFPSSRPITHPQHPSHPYKTGKDVTQNSTDTLGKFVQNYPLPPANLNKISPLLFLFTGALNGYFEPCGCQSDMLGGLAKYLSLLEYYNKNNRKFLLLDAGNSFFEEDNIPHSKRKQALLKAELISRLMKKLNYFAVAIGPRDLRFGIKFLKKLVFKNRLPAVSVNLVWKNTLTPIFSPYKIASLYSYKVAVVGITGNLKNSNPNSDFAIIPPERALSRYNKELAKADFVIILSTGGEKLSTPLLNKISKVALVIEAGEDSIGGAIQDYRGTPLVIPSKDGKKLGVFSLYIQGKSLPYAPVITPRQLRQKIAELEKQRGEYIANAQKLQKKGGDMAFLAKIYLDQAGELKREIKELSERLSLPPELPAGKNGYIVQFIPIKSVIPDHPEAIAEIESYQRQVSNANLEALQNIKSIPRDKQGNFFVGSQKCKLCHLPQYLSWKKTRHGDAYKTLVKRNRHLDFDCIGCHTTGWLKPGGIYRVEQISKLKDVQCEVCHGRGGIHSTIPKKNNITKTPTAKLCTSCHRDEHDPHFKFEKKIVRILSKTHGYNLLLKYLKRKEE